VTSRFAENFQGERKLLVLPRATWSIRHMFSLVLARYSTTVTTIRSGIKSSVSLHSPHLSAVGTVGQSYSVQVEDC
jgi:hypothetical protein